jgi:hypothetical protein
MSAIDFAKMNDQQLAAVIRTQVRQDAMSIQGVPPMQQMMCEAIARILSRPVVVIDRTAPPEGEMRKAQPLQIVKL